MNSNTNADAALISVDDARARILAHVDVVGDEVVSLIGAHNRVLAEALHARRDLPAFDNSAMDGVGVRSVDVAAAAKGQPVRLALTGASLAGASPSASSSSSSSSSSLARMTAVRIMTGAPIPHGVDAIVMRELTDEREIEAGFVSVLEAAPVGQHVRKRGEDVAQGSRVGEVGDVVTPARMNLLLASGHTSARVRRKITVAVMASGDELVDVGEPLSPGSVVNGNAHALAAQARALGCDVRLLGIAKDTLADHVTRIGGGLAGSDVVITIGGVSMGTHDFTRPALEQLGATIDLWRVAMRPGKPIAFARKDGVRVFGLPGNPVSSFVSFELFVRPALLRMQGLVGAPRPLWPAQLVDSEMKKKAGLEIYARGAARLMNGKLAVRLVEGQGSHHMSALANANCLVKFPRAVERVAAGDTVEVMLLSDPLVAADML